jgi:hypothetical protein
MDESEFDHIQANRCTQEALDFTFNAMNFAQKLTKKLHVGGLIFPLNYMLHQRLIHIYTEDSLLVGNFQTLFSSLEGFSQGFLGVKPAFQLLHLAKDIFNTFILGQRPISEKNPIFADLNESQNRALYSIKTLLGKV